MQTEFDPRIKIMVRSVTQFSLLAALIFLVGSNTLLAQQNNDPDNLLPEIDPQDIEIRSEFQARFPGLRRQPILGFNPGSRVYQVSPDRKPFMETQDEVVANLPITDLSRPDAPPYNALYYNPKLNAFARLGVGSFLSPEAAFWGYTELSDKSYFGGNLDYHSSNGHLDKENSSFRYMNLDAEFATKVSDRVILRFNGGLQSDFNRLYELENRESLPFQIPEGPKKEYTGYNAGFSLVQNKNSVEGWKAGADVRHFDTQMFAGDLSGESQETVFNGTLRKEWAGSQIHETFALNAGARGGSYTSADPGDQNWVTARGGAEYNRLFNYSTQVTAKANVVYTSNEFESKIYPGLLGEIKHWFHDAISITGTLSATPKVSTLEHLHQLNRFLNHDLQLRHTYTVETGGELRVKYLEGSSLYAKLSYMVAQNYAYFGKEELGGIVSQPGYFTVNYMDANKIKGSAGVSHQLVPETFWISAEAYVQKPKLDDGSDIPYEEQWGLNSGFSLKPMDRLRIEGWADYVSERKTISSEDLGGFLLLGSQVDIQITDKIGVYAKLLNLLSQEYEIWDGYEERPLQVYGGATIKLN